MKYVYSLKCCDGILGHYTNYNKAQSAALDFVRELDHKITEVKHHPATGLTVYWADYDDVCEITKYRLY